MRSWVTGCGLSARPRTSWNRIWWCIRWDSLCTSLSRETSNKGKNSCTGSPRNMLLFVVINSSCGKMYCVNTFKYEICYLWLSLIMREISKYIDYWWLACFLHLHVHLLTCTFTYMYIYLHGIQTSELEWILIYLILKFLFVCLSVDRIIYTLTCKSTCTYAKKLTF